MLFPARNLTPFPHILDDSYLCFLLNNSFSSCNRDPPSSLFHRMLGFSACIYVTICSMSLFSIYLCISRGPFVILSFLGYIPSAESTRGLKCNS